MTTPPTTVERAFQLAKHSHGMADLRHRLRLEGFANSERELFGSALRQQLQALMPRDWRG